MMQTPVTKPSTGIKFLKMDGTGNEFVIIDVRGVELPDALPPRVVEGIASRDNPTTKGCDQLILMAPSKKADCFMRIYNSDGSESGACGNATRCVAWLLAKDSLPADEFFDAAPINGTKNARSDKPVKVTIETLAGVLKADVHHLQKITVNMGTPRLNWREIPLSEERDTLHMGIELGPLKDPVGVSMGNPHAVFFVPNVEAIDLKTLGPQLEHHPLFPERANIGVASVSGDDITLRVWERGAGETQACGTGACAAFVAAHRRGLLKPLHGARVYLRGGELYLYEEAQTGHILMQGPAKLHYEGTLNF